MDRSLPSSPHKLLAVIFLVAAGSLCGAGALALHFSVHPHFDIPPPQITIVAAPAPAAPTLTSPVAPVMAPRVSVRRRAKPRPPSNPPAVGLTLGDELERCKNDPICGSGM